MNIYNIKQLNTKDVFSKIYENEDKLSTNLVDLYKYYSDHSSITFETSTEIVNELIKLKSKKSDFIEENELEQLLSQLLYFFGIRTKF